MGGKYTTIAEISHIAGFRRPAYFCKVYKELYHISVQDLLSGVK